MPDNSFGVGVICDPSLIFSDQNKTAHPCAQAATAIPQLRDHRTFHTICLPSSLAGVVASPVGSIRLLCVWVFRESKARSFCGADSISTSRPLQRTRTVALAS